MTDLGGKVAVVTGASRGLGQRAAVRLAAHGASLVLVARSETALAATASDIRKKGGRAEVVAANLSDPRSLDDVVRLARRNTQRPLIVKLSPNVTSIAQMARVAEECGADALSLVNTFVAMAIDAETRKPRIANVTAGLSGPAIKPIALRMVYDAAKAVKIPIIGMGGISAAVDIIEFMLAGATAVQIGTASYWDPVATEKIVAELDTWCTEHNVARLADLTGGLVTE